ncbi:MAG: hypothetical protein IKD72_08455, partial [Clostridia bacterium]|nr:hypothetical protein [Clostridia bacterium]
MHPDGFHGDHFTIKQPFHAEQCFSFFFQRVPMQPDYDFSGFCHDEPLPQKRKTAFLNVKCSGFVDHRQTALRKLAVYQISGSLYNIPIMIQNQEVVIVLCVVAAKALQIVIKLIEQRDLIQLIDLTSEACSSLAVWICFYDFCGSRIL